MRLLLVLLALCSGTVALAASDESAPRISDVRIGFDGVYKAGNWTPVQVEVEVDASVIDLRLEVVAPDNDGVMTIVESPLTRDAASPGRATALAYTRVGRVGAPIRVTLFSGDNRLDEQALQPGKTTGNATLVALAPTAELQLALGDSAFNLLKLLGSNQPSGAATHRRVAKVSRVADLPTDWFGYDAVNVLVISAADQDLLQELAADEKRYAALTQWVELGGRLVILCGGEDAKSMLADGGPLAGLAPGKMEEVVRLPDTAAIEHFAKTGSPLASATTRAPIFMPRMVDIEGKIEVYGGRKATDFPLVIRAPRGLGEVAFVALDFTRPPLSEWDGRSAFLQNVFRPYVASTAMAEASEALVSSGYNDLSGALRQRLGRAFSGVSQVSFPLVAALALAYVLVLGPLDYFVVNRWLRRPLLAWISFPFIVLLFGLSALAIADWRSSGAATRVNQLELVDIDMTTGRMRGTFWATLFSPRAEQFDLVLSPAEISKLATEEPQTLLTWWGLAGSGIGGMQGRTTDIGVRGGYRQAGALLEGVPVLTSSTKSLAARWTARTQPLLDAKLVEKDGLATGPIENRTGQQLRNVRLFYNGFAYRLGNLAPNQRIEVGEQSSPRSVKTVVTQDVSGAAVQSEVNVFQADRASVKELLNLMMFYELAGGLAFAKLPFEYQAYCDLSHTLELGRAILVADVPAGGSQLVNGASKEPLAGEDDSRSLVYRFVLPVQRNEAAQ